MPRECRNVRRWVPDARSVCAGCPREFRDARRCVPDARRDVPEVPRDARLDASDKMWDAITGPAEWLYSPLWRPTFQSRKIPLSPVTRDTFYGLPSNVEVDCMELDCITIPGLTFIRVRVLVMYDVGLAGVPVIQEFLSVHVYRDGVIRGMLPPPPPDAPGWV